MRRGRALLSTFCKVQYIHTLAERSKKKKKQKVLPVLADERYWPKSTPKLQASSSRPLSSLALSGLVAADDNAGFKGCLARLGSLNSETPIKFLPLPPGPGLVSADLQSLARIGDEGFSSDWTVAVPRVSTSSHACTDPPTVPLTNIPIRYVLTDLDRVVTSSH